MTSIFELKIDNLPESGLAVTMMVDGKPFGEDCVDMAELRKSAILSGAYDLQTCGCGTPQCAGFWEPIFVQHGGDVIRWEFDSRFHPIPSKDEGDESEMSVVRYEFDRVQYVSEIRGKLEWLRHQPNRNSLGPHGFDASILDEDFPDTALPQFPFPRGSMIVLGYTSGFHQPWIWVEDHPEIYPRQLLPTGHMWAMFGCWSLMWDCQYFDLGQCLYREDPTDFALIGDVSADECNQKVKQLAHEVQRYWGTTVEVAWDRIDETARSVIARCQASHSIEHPA